MYFSWEYEYEIVFYTYVNGKSLMQQPCTNSEGVRRCMTIPDIPRSSQLCYQPRAQNRANRDKQFRRPCSPGDFFFYRVNDLAFLMFFMAMIYVTLLVSKLFLNCF